MNKQSTTIDDKRRIHQLKNSQPDALWRSAYFNERGEEIDITEAMIQQACSVLQQELDTHFLVPRSEKT